MPDIKMLAPAKQEFLGRPYTGTMDTLIAIDKVMRTAVRLVAGNMPRRIPQDTRFARARHRVRRHVNMNWRQGPTDGLDLLAWLREIPWETLGRRMGK